MADDASVPHFWDIEVEDGRALTSRAPSESASSVLRALMENATRPEEFSLSVTLKQVIFKILMDSIRLKLPSWNSKLPSSIGASNQKLEGRNMAESFEIGARKRDDERIKRLELVISNPELAQESFPDKNERENFIPLLKAIRTLTEDSQ